ncbi:phosphopantothenoylcysteine decarboxylase [Babesia ovata]|uniref:Phosphopantothenoylcysteine decarboxylase n=1 Tax=Babesia ovata TaxID=189622 RepID=A0A2H6KCS8_9APIC|nr:phosphopantothenoylcysteine decarboxylase [Babesia ovata]GBE60801.1 phosphopantothenoylcysteine decarboxylase [Babesia ovata]
MASQRNLLIGVTGSVAAIKLPEIIGEIKRHAEKNAQKVDIRAVATQSAIKLFKNSIETAGCEVLSDNDVEAPYTRGDPILHIELRRWADLFVICPLDCNTLAKIANGLCDNLLTDVARCWDFKKPIWVYPCMNPLMFQHPVTAEHISKLQSFGVKVTIVLKRNTLNCWSTLNERLRETKHEINRATRELERQRLKYEREEKTLIQKLKTEAKSGRMQNVRIMAKDLVRSRKLALHYAAMKSQMAGIMCQLQNAQSTNLMASSLKNVNKIISKVSNKTNIAEFQKIIQSLGRESEVINLKLDVMSEALDNSFMDVDSVDEEERIISQILEELGIDASAAIPSVTASPVKESATTVPVQADPVGPRDEMHDSPRPTSDDPDSIESRINNLRGKK